MTRLTRTALVAAVVTASSIQICSGFMHTPTCKPEFLATPSSTRPATLLQSTKFDRDVNDMFNFYDADGNGQIDKEEFRQVVKKMNSSSRRREIISVAAATFGSLVSHSSSCSFIASLKYSQ